MAKNSKIEWTEHTANLWHGCTKVHAGCDHCYAETMTKRWGRDIWGNDNPRMIIQSTLKDLERMQQEAATQNTLALVFVGSMMDIFEKSMPTINHKGEPQAITTGQLRDFLFSLIELGMFDNLIFLFLTKRPSNINKMVPPPWLENPPPNVMFGTSPCDQKTADTLVPQLLQVKGKKFLSCEPLLGPISFLNIPMYGFQGLKNFVEHGPRLNNQIDWVIVGGESGHHARPMNIEWAINIKNQCTMAGIPFFMKQLGGSTDKRGKIETFPEDLQIREYPKYHQCKLKEQH